MKGSKLFTASESGVYKCVACDTLSVHITGFSKEPCSECGSNSNWVAKNLTVNNAINKYKYKYR